MTCSLECGSPERFEHLTERDIKKRSSNSVSNLLTRCFFLQCKGARIEACKNQHLAKPFSLCVRLPNFLFFFGMSPKPESVLTVSFLKDSC